MKLQDLCERIIARHKYPIIMGNDFIVKMIKDISKKDLIIDNLLNGVDLNPFNEMEDSIYIDPFTIVTPDVFGDAIISEPPYMNDIFNNICYESAINNFDDLEFVENSNISYGWPATFADIMA